MLASKVEVKNNKRQVSPQINPNLVGLAQGFYLLYELYNPFDLSAVRIFYKIRKRYELAIDQSEVQHVRKGSNSFLTNISAENLSVGAYTLEMTVTRTDDTTDTGVLAKATKLFIIEWLSAGSPVSIADLDEAIEQMKYFASSDDLDHIKDTKDEKVKKERFEEFWEKRNPSPGSKFNRAMVEYYRRVAYANEAFKHYIDGWKTDRGMVYIIYGAPSAVDRHPLDVESKPYEIWEYYDVSKRFVFIDESGFGDYRLLYPIWDDRNRLR
jgi:GWxTD domain-containing protein